MADKFKAELVGARAAASRFRRAGRVIDSNVSRELAALGDVSIVVFRGHAQRDTGRLHRGITRRGGGAEIIVRADAVSDEGYDYVGVTRFGHSVDRIYPKKAKALKTPFGFFRSVRGYHPASDWAEDSYPAIRSRAQVTSERLGRRIVAEI